MTGKKDSLWRKGFPEWGIWEAGPCRIGAEMAYGQLGRPAMTILAFSVVLFSALLHASWNLVAKKAGGGPGFVCLFSAMALFLLAPAAWISALGMGTVSFSAYRLVLVSALCEAGYYLSLQKAYGKGDLSVIYPVARSTGPLVTVLVAPLFLGEELGGLALAGTALVLAGNLLLVTGKRHDGEKSPWGGVCFGLLAGFCIAGYTLVDKTAVSRHSLPPVLYFWAVLLLQTVFIAPLALAGRENLKAAWTLHRREAFIIAVLSSVSYILILWVLSFSPVSRIAPCREVGIVFGVCMGALFLGERGFRGRLTASAAVFAGILLLFAS